MLWYNTNVGILVMDQTLNMLGMTSMFVGGFTALILDNMIPGMTWLKPLCSVCTWWISLC